jgi:hypothetical protein
MSITKFYKIIKPAAPSTSLNNNEDQNGYGGSYGNLTWYNRLISGSSQRIQKYKEYDVMDADVDIAKALDVIAEEICGNNPKTELPLEIKITAGTEQVVTSLQVVTLKAALRTWCNLHDWSSRVFTIARNTVKYGDTFFLRPKIFGKKFSYIHPRNVRSAIVSEEDVTEVRGWEMALDYQSAISNQSNINGANTNGMFNITNQNGSQYLKSQDVVRFSLNNDMTDEAPFGESILRAIYKTFKQKELLESAILIYRIQRAPEKLIFNVDVGKMPAHMIARHMESFKNEIKQKKIPTNYGKETQVESTYNPNSMSENYYFAKRSDGSGSSVEVLPGGQNLGNLEDLDYFYNKMWRGLRIPKSYFDGMTEGGGSANDGKVGIAYIQEIKFSLYIERLQRELEKTFDAEFKKFLIDAKIKVDPTIFNVVLPEPSNYSKSRQQTINADLLNNYSNADGIESLSKRFALKKYLGLTEDEIKENERMKKEELGMDPDGDDILDLPKIYAPDAAEAGGFEGGLGGGRGSIPGDTTMDGLDDEGDTTDEGDDVEGDIDTGEVDDTTDDAPPTQPQT